MFLHHRTREVGPFWGAASAITMAMKTLVLCAGENAAPRLELQDLKGLQPGPGDVVVRLFAAALNRRDYWITKGKYAGIKLPCVLGSDGVGVIGAVGPGVAPERLGEKVVLCPNLDWGPDPRVASERHRILGMPDNGTLAEEIVIPAENALPMPGHLSVFEAAALPLAGLTAYRALYTRGRLRPSEVVLLPGIGSGVQCMALLFARHLGARVFVTSSSQEKLQRALELGAEGGVDHTQKDWERQLLAKAPAPDLVVDGAGGETFTRCLGVVRPGGRVVSYGATAGPANFEVRRLFWKQLDVLGSTMGTPAEFREMLSLVGAGKLRPVVDQVVPLEEASAAFARMERGDAMGKLVVRISSEG